MTLMHRTIQICTLASSTVQCSYADSLLEFTLLRLILENPGINLHEIQEKDAWSDCKCANNLQDTSLHGLLPAGHSPRNFTEIR